MIRLEHMKKSYEKVTPLKDVNVTINKGDVISIIGPSGTGKSTLIRCINMLDPPTSGKIYFDGEEITNPKCNLSEIRKRMGMVFQSFNLFSNLNVIDNIITPPMDLLKMPREEAFEEGMRLLSMVGLAEKAYSFPDELSGGQKQRVAIARAIAMKPEVILFDEPTSALDPTSVGEVLSVIRNLSKQGLTMMIVTHEMKFARDVSNRVFYMDQGGIYEDGSPKQIFENPQKERTRAFIKKLKTMSITVESKTFDFLGINSQIERFGKDNLIAPKTILNIQRVFEEVVILNVLPKLSDSFSIHMIVEYSEANDTVSLNIDYTGDKYNAIEDGDELSTAIVKRYTKKTEYNYDDKNYITIEF